MATISKQYLTGPIESLSGTFIGIGIVNPSGTVIHTSQTANSIEEVWLWATNIHTSPVALTLEWGAKISGHLTKVTIPSQEGLFQIIPGFPVTSGVVISAYASVSGVVSVAGYVNRIT